MASIKELHDTTKQLYEHVEKPMPKEEREEYIETLQTMLLQREVLINKFEGFIAKSNEEKIMANDIISWNTQINHRLSNYLTMIKVDLNHLKKQKDTGKKYENPYQHDTIDGMFIDKKK